MDGAFPCVDANVSSAPLPGLNFTVYSLDSKIYRGSPVYAVFTTADPTAAVLGICNMVFLKSKNPRKAGTFCTL